jgi:hypothetical protein
MLVMHQLTNYILVKGPVLCTLEMHTSKNLNPHHTTMATILQIPGRPHGPLNPLMVSDVEWSAGIHQQDSTITEYRV